MAISTYTDLKTSIANWLHRGGLTNVIPDFISFCEADFNRRLRISQMEVRATASFNEAYENLPTDFLELREVKVTGDREVSLKYLTPDQMTEMYPIIASGQPSFYTIVDSRIRVNTIPSSTVEMSYYAPFAALSSTNATNWMLTNNPDLYMWGSLACAETHLKNDKRLPMWKALYEAALKQVDDADKKARWGGPMQIRAG